MIYILSGRSHFQFKTRTWSMAWTPVIKSHGSFFHLTRTAQSKVLPPPPEKQSRLQSDFILLLGSGLFICSTYHHHVVSERFVDPYRLWLYWLATVVKKSVFLNEHLVIMSYLNSIKFVDP